MYVSGRDKNFRPLIVFRPRILTNMNVSIGSQVTKFFGEQPRPELSDGLTACTFIMEYVRKNFHLPGQIENWVILMDMDNLSLTNIPYSVLIDSRF